MALLYRWTSPRASALLRRDRDPGNHGVLADIDDDDLGPGVERQPVAVKLHGLNCTTCRKPEVEQLRLRRRRLTSVADLPDDAADQSHKHQDEQAPHDVYGGLQELEAGLPNLRGLTVLREICLVRHAVRFLFAA